MAVIKGVKDFKSRLSTRPPADEARGEALMAIDEAEPFDVTIRQIRALRGPSLYAYFPVLKIILDTGPYEEQASDRFPGFVERLAAWLPGLEGHECSLGRPGGFIERLKRGTYLGHISEHIAIELQSMIGFNVGYGRVRGTGERGVYNIIVEYEEEEPAREAFRVALRLCLAAMHDLPFDVDGEVEALSTLANRYRLGPSTEAIVNAARARHIPILRLTPTQSLVQLGYGVHQKRIMASQTNDTSVIAVDICQEKGLTNQILREVAVPVPDGKAVHSADEAWEVAQAIGLPVVVKPEDANQGKGVGVNLQCESQVRSAYQIASSFSSHVLVERYLEGDDYRLLVVGGKMVAAARRDPAQVVGDGKRTIRELVERINQDPARRPGHSGILSRITLDDSVDLVLQQQGLTLDSIPGHKKVIRLRNNANLSTGGTATDVTDEVHPDNARLAELTAQILDLNIAGIDILARDISRPLEEQGGGIVEVNAAPGLRMHLHPSEGRPRDVATPIIEMLYPVGAPSRIPIIAITGTNGKTTVTRLVAHIFQTAKKVVGITSTEGTYVDNQLVMEGDCSGPKSARAVLMHPYVQVAVLETARGGILREGLAFDYCSTGVVTNLSADHLGLGGVETLEELAAVKQVVIEAVHRDGAGVLNANDPLVAEMAAACDGQVIYFSTAPNNPIVATHLAHGGKCVLVEENTIVLAEGERRFELVELERLPFTMSGKIPFQVQNALAAVAAAWAEDVSPAIIARALSTFHTDFESVPARFNLSEANGVQVIIDYGHNPAALEALGQAVQALDERETVMVIALPGDRRDEDIIASVKATVPYVDRYILYDLADRRERARSEVPRLMQGAIPDDLPSHIEANERDAILRAWQYVKPGDRLIVISDVPKSTYELIQGLVKCAWEEASCVSSAAGSRNGRGQHER